jgi:SAM-dependent methyltransferase
VLLAQSKWTAATAAFERAIAVNPELAEAHCNLGDAFHGQGQMQQAERHYMRALAIRPAFAEAHNKLGVVLVGRGAFTEAGQHFQTALRLQPRLTDAYTNLAALLLMGSKSSEALAVLRQALSISDAVTVKRQLAQCIRLLTDLPDNEDFRTLVFRAISEQWARPNDMVATAVRLLKRDSVIGAGVSRALQTPRLPARELLPPAGWETIAENQLLHALMETAIVSDIEFERFLTVMRSALVPRASISIASVPEKAHMLNLRCALAQQCFINEYVFASTDDEISAVALLRDQIISAMAAGTPIAPTDLVAVASFHPLHSLPGAARLLDRTWPQNVDKVLTQQVREPEEEAMLGASVSSVTAIRDSVSLAVQDQYEQNPYPRWVKSRPGDYYSLRIDQHLRNTFPAAVFQSTHKEHLDILVAGCGTGQYAIESATRFSSSHVLAIDLSRASLAYAIRKAREAGVGNIEFRQADILELGSLGQTFDIIDASGVLHHLNDPLAGWRLLLSLMRPGGYMEVGLYSEIARAEVVEARAFIQERGYDATPPGIRSAREAIARDERAAFKRVRNRGDFFSMSSCRDLLFHVQEHRFTIPQISAFLAESGLNFIGFEVDAATVGRYRARFPADPAMTELKSWEAFEIENPETFIRMYQFWVQKPLPVPGP